MTDTLWDAFIDTGMAHDPLANATDSMKKHLRWMHRSDVRYGQILEKCRLLGLEIGRDSVEEFIQRLADQADRQPVVNVVAFVGV